MGKILNWLWIPNLFLAFLLLTSCSLSQKMGLKTSGADKKEPTPLAVELNNKGVEILAEANTFFAGDNSQQCILTYHGKQCVEVPGCLRHTRMTGWAVVIIPMTVSSLFVDSVQRIESKIGPYEQKSPHYP